MFYNHWFSNCQNTYWNDNNYKGQAGAMDEETFFAAFEDVPTVKLFSAKDLEEQMKNIKDTIGDDKKDWKQRADSVSLFHQ